MVWARTPQRGYAHPRPLVNVCQTLESHGLALDDILSTDVDDDLDEFEIVVFDATLELPKREATR